MLLPATLFAAMIAYLPGVVSSTVAGRWAVLSIGAGALLVSMRGKPLLGPAHGWAALLFVWAGLSLLWSASPYDTAGELYHWLVLGLVFLAASQYKEKPETLLSALVLGLCVSVPFALLQFQNVLSLGLAMPSPVIWTDGPAGLFLSRNTLGEIAACLLVWAAARKSWLLVPAPLLLVVLSGSRGAWLALGCGLAYGLWRLGYNWIVLLASIPVFAIGLAVLAGTHESVMIRFDIWLTTLVNLTPFGHGLNTFAAMAPQYGFSHNDFFQLAFELGVGSLLAIPLFVYAVRTTRIGRGPAFPEACAFVALAGASLVSFPLHHPVGAMLMALLSGYCCGTRDRSERSQSVLRAAHFLGIYRLPKYTPANGL